MRPLVPEMTLFFIFLSWIIICCSCLSFFLSCVRFFQMKLLSCLFWPFLFQFAYFPISILLMWKCLFSTVALFRCHWLQNFFRLSVYTVPIISFWLSVTVTNLFLMVMTLIVFILLDLLLLPVIQRSNSTWNLASSLWTRELNVF